MICSACQGPYHPATGHILAKEDEEFGCFVLCGPCAISFKDWLKGRMGAMQARLKNKHTGTRMEESFHDAAMKSIKGE
jgi:hypothetical protein